MQSVNFALLNFYNIENSKDTFDESMIEPLLNLFKEKYKLDACFIALIIDDTYELVIGKNSVNKEFENFVKIYNLGQIGYQKLFKNYDDNFLCNHANTILDGESILHYGVFRDDKTLDGIVGFADFHNNNRIWTKEERESLIKLGRTLRLAVLYEKVKLQSKQQLSKLKNEFNEEINIITSVTSEYSSIFLIDYDTLVQTLYYTNGKYKTILDIVQKELYYPKSTVLAVYASVYKDDRKRVLEATEINNVKSRLAADGIYTVNYRRYIDDVLDYAAFRYSLITINNKKMIVLSIKEITDPCNEKEESEYDNLTGLFTKEEFLRRCEDKVSLTKDLSKLHMIVFDVDRITQYNAYFGMENGNILLKHIASTLKTLTEKSDSIYCRLGADRFAILLNSEINELEELIKNIKSNIRYFNPKFIVNLSFGICNVESKNTPIVAVIDGALSAIKGSKYKYNKLYQMYDEGIFQQRKNDKFILDNMENALKENKIVPYYQPLYDIVNNKVISFEALARWQEADEIINISEFLDLFITTNYIYNMDILMWDNIIKYLKYREQNNLAMYSVDVNVCDEYITYKQLPETLNTIIKRYNIDANLINLEINEKAFINNFNDAIETVKKLKEYGFKIVIDNFVSAINLLSNPIFDAIKINMSKFDIEKDKVILNSIFNLANSLNVDVIAFKVEDENVYNFIKESNVKYAQGFYFNKALSENEINKF